ncbi:DUF4837 family protein [candidate division KSB1 bacterium]|nr:DUF4837 family protein [candidate division KSB1 bacterium]
MNRKQHVIFALGIALLLLIALSCSMKRESLGSLDKIIVIADSTEWAAIGDDVLAVMDRTINTPQPESIFNLLQKNPAELKKLTRFPNLLVVGTLEVQGEMGELLEKLIAGSQSRIEADSAFLFNKTDPWAKNQLLVLAVSRDIPTLRKNLRENGERMFKLFDENMAANVLKSLYVHFEQQDISKKLMEKHGWSIRVQHDYFVAVDSSEIRYVWLRRVNPQRWFSVYWEPTDDPSLLSKEWMVQKRADIIANYYDGDYIYEDDTMKVQENIVDFNGRYAIRLDGVWQNDKHVMGGPFRSYGFYDEGDGRLYLIDLSVYAPGQPKYQYLRQLDGIASTFRTRAAEE